MSKTMSHGLLAKSNFLAGVQEELIAIDVYGKNDASVVNKIQDVAQLFDVDLTNILKGGQFVEKDFPIIEDVSEGLLNINKDNLVTRIAGVSSSIGSALQSVKAGIENQLSNVQALGDVYSKVNGIISKIQNADLTDINSLTKLVSDVTGDSRLLEVVDKAAETGLYVGIIKEAASKGIPDALGAVVDTIKDQEVLNGVIKNILPSTINTSDVRMLASIVDSDISKISELFDKNYLKKFINDYSFGKGFNDNEEIKAFTLLKETLDIADSLWSKKSIIEDSIESIIPDITKIASSSDDFKNGLLGFIKEDEDLPLNDKLLALGTTYSQDDVDRSLSLIFPFNVRGELDTNSSNPVTPRLS